MSKKDNKKKKKKAKVTYIDDGRSLADMSDVKGGFRSKGTRKGTYGDAWKTYVAAVKMMLKPMLVTLLIITLAFMLVWIFLKLSTLIF